jgi:hypothetical protein
MLLEEKVKKLLEGLEIVKPEVRIIDHYGLRILAQVVSPSFETMDEGDRQVLVWGKLLDELPDRESRMVEFVYTDSPSEIEEAEAQAADPNSR